MKAHELRKKFLKFFESKGHTVVASDLLVPAGDPTLLFTSAGMNQFKEQFMGRNITYPRAASCQKCLRTADLANVGKTAYHHTFFEMLGNFSFGDYFKKEAITWAWEFMTGVLKFPAQRLWVSVYHDDDEAHTIWRDSVGVAPEKIIKLGDKENFWPSNAKKDGPNGPCGPCSEIFYDWGRETGCGRQACDPGCDCGRFVEVWNLVFTQFNRTGVDRLEPLASKNIDTGMGLERLAAVMQGVRSNFETDLFRPIVDAIDKLSAQGRGTRECGAVRSLPEGDEGRGTKYAIADHVRAVCFAILDGVMPSNEGRGYVIRKLIRTSFLHGRKLGITGPFLYKLTFGVAKAMQEPYPEIGRRHEDIAGVIKSEEELFEGNLDVERAKALYQERFAELAPSGTEITGASARSACLLFDTYGIPPELTKAIAKEKQHIIDEELWDRTYEQEVEKLRELSRKKSAFAEDIFASEKVTAALQSMQKTEFIGYETTSASACMLKMVRNGEEVSAAKAGDHLLILLDKTPFYGEAGGQVGDTGTLEKKGTKIEIQDTKRDKETIIHIGVLREGSVKVGDTVTARVDADRRKRIEKNHTATHLLHNALRKVLGEHVHQSGSVVDDRRLRFDFTHGQKLSPHELQAIEAMVNAHIQRPDQVATEDDVEIDRARNDGAIALFGEKYDKRVRVVSVGAYSKELCGGTHVAKTADIRLFKITSEGSVAAGLRRIEAVTDVAAEDYVIHQEASLIQEMRKRLAELEKMLDDVGGGSEAAVKARTMIAKARVIKPTITKPLSPTRYRQWEESGKPRLEELLELLAELTVKLEKTIFSSKVEQSKALADGIIAHAATVGGATVIAQEINDVDPKVLNHLADELKKKVTSGIILLATRRESRISFACAVTADLVKRGFHAGKLIKEVAARTGGGGGGRADFAMAGGKDPSRLSEALEYVQAISKQELKK